jgi:Holliday junction resolvase RusA-like endonuclease
MKTNTTEHTTSFWVNLPPIKTTHQSEAKILKTRDGRFFVGKGRNSKIRSWCSAFAMQAKRHLPPTPHMGPLSLLIAFYFEPPISVKKKLKLEAGEAVPMTVRPDCSNLVKALEDTLTKCGFWHDDSQIFCLRVDKYHSVQSGVYVSYTTHEYYKHHHINGGVGVPSTSSPEPQQP